MTASAGAWYRVGTVNVTNGQQSIVGVNTAWQNDVISIAVGDIFTLDAKTWYEVTAVNSDTSLTLDRGFEGATQNTANYAIVRNTSGTLLTRIAGQIAVQFNQKQLFLDELRTWLNSDNAAEELTDSHGVKKQLKTPAQMVRDHDEKLAQLDTIHPHPWAMRKVEFEAMRAANREKYAASGFVHKGKRYLDTWNKGYIDSLYSPSLGSSEAPNNLFIGSLNASAPGDSKQGAPKILLAGVETQLEYLSSSNKDLLNKIKLPPAENGTRTYDSATGESLTHATATLAFAAETATNKVVTDRLDGWGLLQIEQELNDDYPFVYAKGLPQSLASKINGVATSTNNIQPIEYFAWYEGDTTSRGKGVNWQMATEAQRIAIASDPENKIYFNDETGRFYQTHVFGLSWRGAGNGDWQNVDAVAGDLQYDPYSKVSHALLGITKFTAGKEKGVFTADNNPNCHILFCGTLERLNMGANHPSNPLGSKLWNREDAQGGVSWNSALVAKPVSRAAAFNQTTAEGVVGAREPTGRVGQSSGRPDGRHYDAIYASGLGGVCRDMRYSARGLTDVDFAEADLRIKSGEYRGRELLKFTKFEISPQQTATVSNGIVVSDASSYSLGDYVVLVHPTDGTVFKGVVTRINDPVNGVYLDNSGTYNRQASTYYIAHSAQLKTSVADEYTHTEVIGAPEQILLCDDLKDGWVGSWNPAIPDSTTKTISGTKPCSEHLITISTGDSGATWSNSSPVNFDNATNSHTAAFSDSGVWVVAYKTKAKMTTSSVNSEVYGGRKGIGAVHATSYYLDSRGRSLGFSLVGKINTNTLYAPELGQQHSSSPSLLDAITFDGKLNGLFVPKHPPLSLGVPNNNSPAFKALNYNVAKNQQGFINYAYAELTYDATVGDWGDDGKIHIADNQTTMLDENGHTNLVGAAQTVEPLGWLKNDK